MICVTTPTVNATKFTLTRDDIKLYTNIVNEIRLLDSRIDADQEEIINAWTNWIDGNLVEFDNKVFALTFKMIDFVNNCYDEIMKDLKESRFDNMELFEKGVTENELSEKEYVSYGKHLKNMSELIDMGVFKLWFSRRAAVLSKFNPKIHSFKITVGIEAVDISFVEKPVIIKKARVINKKKA